MERVAVHDVEAALDDDRGGRGGAGGEEAEEDAEGVGEDGGGDLAGHGGGAVVVEEHADEEAGGDDGAGDEDAEGRAGGEEEVGEEDGDGEDESPRDLVEGRVDVLEGIVVEARKYKRLMMRDDHRPAHLKPMTLMHTIGARPRQRAASRVKGILKSPTKWAARKRMTAMQSCANRKKSGAAVELRTHLFLHTYASGTQAIRGSRSKPHAMTIYPGV